MTVEIPSMADFGLGKKYTLEYTTKLVPRGSMACICCWCVIAVLHSSSWGEPTLVTPVRKHILGKPEETNQLFCTHYSSQHDTFPP